MEKKVPVYWVVIGTLIWTIIIVYSSFQCRDLDVVQYIGFASTITSLALGVIAIFYSIVSNNQSAENLGKLKDTSTEIESSSKTIKDISSGLMSVSQKLQMQLDELPNHIQSLRSDISATRDDISKIQLVNEDIKVNRTSSTANNDASLLTDNQIDSLLQDIPFAAMLIIYALKLSEQKGGKINFEALAGRIYSGFKFDFGIYYLGVLSTLKALKLINGKFIQTEVLSLEYINLHLSLVVEKEMIKKAEENDREHNFDENHPDSWIKKINEIKLFFKK